jgi:hypothetical protein
MEPQDTHPETNKVIEVDLRQNRKPYLPKPRNLCSDWIGLVSMSSRAILRAIQHVILHGVGGSYTYTDAMVTINLTPCPGFHFRINGSILSILMRTATNSHFKTASHSHRKTAKFTIVADKMPMIVLFCARTDPAGKPDGRASNYVVCTARSSSENSTC